MKYDVIVIGSGTVGLTIANLLANLKLKICLIEKKSGINKTSNAVGVNDECLLAWQICGIIDEIAPFIGYNNDGDIILKYLDEQKKELISLRQSIGIEGFRKGVVFLQNKIDEILLKNLRQKIDINFNEEFEDLTQDYQSIIVKTSNKTYKAKYLIAADGKDSAVRNILEIKFKKISESKDEWLILNLLAKTPILEKKFVEVFCGSRSVVSCPLPQGHHRIEISLKEDEKNILENENKIKEICNNYFDLSNYEIIEKFKYRFITGIAERYFKKRVVLCGDAAHSSSPFASAGLVSGIRDAMVLYKIFQQKDINFSYYHSLRYSKQLKSLKLAILLEKIMRPDKLLMNLLFPILKIIAKSKGLISLISIRP